MSKLIKILKKRWYVVVIIIAAIAFVLIRQQQAAAQLAAEKTYTITRQTVREELSFSGTIDAREKVTLQFATSGRLNWVGVKEGDRVKKWQAIASLDQTEAYKNLQKALRDYSKERNDFDEEFKVTYRSQTPQTALTDTLKRILEKNQWDLEKSVLDVELKNYSLKLATLTTPIAGIVTNVTNATPGTNILYTTTQFDVVNPESLYFSANADQTEVVKLSEEMSADIMFDSYPEATISGSIKNIAYTPKTDETGTVYEIDINFPLNGDLGKYRLGMTGDVTFLVKERLNILTIPTSSIIKEDGKPYVNLKVNNKPVKHEIQTGEEIDSQTEVVSGLSEGDVIFTSPDISTK